MPINAHPDYIEAEKKFHNSQTDEERLLALEEMVKTAPSHKGGETLRVNLKSRYKKLKEKLQKEKQKARSRKKNQQGIRKLDMQAVILGFTNSGKSSLFEGLTGKKTEIASYGFTTQQPEQGIMDYENCPIQIIDLPPIGSENFDSSLVNTTDTILIIVERINEIAEIKKIIKNSKAKQIIVFNKIDLFDEETKRKIKETLRSKKYSFEIVSTKTDEGIEELKEKIFKSFDKIRVYTKQPNEKYHDNRPLILLPNSTIEDIAKRLLHSSTIIKRTKLWGPSSKFSGQTVGLKHILKDKDIVEFTTF